MATTTKAKTKVDSQIEDVEKEIKDLQKEIEKAKTKSEEGTNQFWTGELKQLRDKEKQLRKEKEQLRDEKIAFLPVHYRSAAPAPDGKACSSERFFNLVLIFVCQSLTDMCIVLCWYTLSRHVCGLVLFADDYVCGCLLLVPTRYQ